MKLIDSHAHLDLSEFRKERKQVVENARKAGVCSIITIGIGIKESEDALKIAGEYPFIYAAVGIHPHNAKTLSLDALDFLEKNSQNKKAVAIGEIGLDFFRNMSSRQEQIRCFRAQLDLAKSLKLPVIIHDRDAHKDILEILRQEHAEQIGGVIHCFSGDLRMALTCIDMGFYISIPGTVTFSNAGNVRAVAEGIPLENLLIETDAPFLAPVPFRGKRNEPAYVKIVAEKIAEIKNIPVDEVAQVTTSNACTLFRLSGDHIS